MDITSIQQLRAKFWIPKIANELCIAALVIGFLGLAIWWERLQAALFVDEAATYWMIKDGIGEGVSRALSIPGQSWLYAALMSIWSAIFGAGEISLRVPSVLCAIISCVLLVQLARLRTARLPVLCGILLAVNYSFAFAATVARPYSLGLLLCALSLVLLQASIQKRGRGLLYCAASTAALAAYLHITFLAIVVAHIVILIEAQLRAQAPKQLWRALSVFFIILAPMIVQYAFLTQERILEIVILDRLPSTFVLLNQLFSIPVALIAALLLSLKLTIFRRRKLFASLHYGEIWVGIALFAGAKLMSLLGAIAVNPTLLIPRYSVLSSLGEAFLSATLLSSVYSTGWRSILVGLTLAYMILHHFFGVPLDLQWGPIVERAQDISSREDCKTVALVGFAESRHVNLLTREPTRSFIASPVNYYGLKPPVLLPVAASSDAEKDYFEVVVYPELAGGRCYLTLTWNVFGAPLTAQSSGPQVVERFLGAKGCIAEEPLTQGLVTLVHWSCPSSVSTKP